MSTIHIWEMKFAFVLAVVVVVGHAASVEEQWQEFKLNHGRTYKSLLEEKRRFAIFQENVRQIEEHNKKFENGDESFEMGVNKFTDMSNEEFAARFKPFPSQPLGSEMFNDTRLLGNTAINWVTEGIVTPVRDQGNCGACWAFAAVHALESQVAMHGGGLVKLSPQNLVDCSRNGNFGCDGGLMANAYEYVTSHGVLTEAQYRYVGRQGTCRKRGGQKIARYANIVQNEAALLRVLSTHGPVASAVEANTFQHYRSGIINDRIGCTTDINHAVTLVGAGSENGIDYWLIKNSWGTGWGEAGYFRLIRGHNACGINLINTLPILH